MGLGLPGQAPEDETQQYQASAHNVSGTMVGLESHCRTGGSSINGGELFLAALATCFCNDLYREAAKRGMDVREVTVDVTGTFGNPGEPARDISYHVQVRADAPQTQIDDLIRTTDAVTEIQNTVRGGCAVKLIMSG